MLDPLDLHARRLTFLRRPRGPWVGLRELAIFAAAYLTYFGVRAMTEGSIPQALANAGRIAHVERLARRRLGGRGAVGDPRPRRPRAAGELGLHLRPLARAACSRACCSSGTDPGEYYLLRDVCLISGAIGLVIFAPVPVAPPRLAGVRGSSTRSPITRGGYRTGSFRRSLVNEYAAMPSFHAGWSVLLGIVLFRSSSSRWPLRAFALAHADGDGDRGGGDRQPLRARRLGRHGDRAGGADRGRSSQSVPDGS